MQLAGLGSLCMHACILIPPLPMRTTVMGMHTHHRCRYPATYPKHPPVLKMSASEGLDPTNVKQLMHALNDSAAQHARVAEVRAFITQPVVIP